MKLTFVYRAQRHQYSLDKTPMKTLKEFFHQFCQEHELDPEVHDLLMRNKPLTNSQLYNPIRFADLPPNVPIEVVQKKSARGGQTSSSQPPSSAQKSSAHVVESRDTSAKRQMVDEKDQGEASTTNSLSTTAQPTGQSQAIPRGEYVKVAFQLPPSGRLIETVNTGSTFREELERLQNEGKIPHDVNVDNIKLVFMRRTFENDNLLMKFRDIGIKAGVSASFRVLYPVHAQVALEPESVQRGPTAASASAANSDTTMGGAPEGDTIENQVKNALKALQEASFSSDMITCIEILVKVLDNVIAKPLNEKVRSIRLSNPKIAETIARYEGAIKCLELAGFSCEQGDSVTGPALVLHQKHERGETIMSVRSCIRTFGEEVGAKIPEPPDLQQYETTKKQGVQAVEKFDPFKSNVTRVQPLPGKEDDGSKNELSNSERNLNTAREKIKQLRDNLPYSASNPPSRQTVMFEKNKAPKLQSSKEESNNSPSVSSLLFQAQKRREKEISGDETLRTSAMREAENLKKLKIYAWTIIRVSFPDGCVLQGIFSPQETVNDIKKWILDSFGDNSTTLPPFQLVVSPPRTVLKESATLDDTGLQPAAVVLFSPQDREKMPSCVSGVIPQELLAKDDYEPPSFPKALSIRGSDSASSTVDSTHPQSSSSSARQSQESTRSSKGKPSWLKI